MVDVMVLTSFTRLYRQCLELWAYGHFTWAVQSRLGKLTYTESMLSDVKITQGVKAVRNIADRIYPMLHVLHMYNGYVFIELNSVHVPLENIINKHFLIIISFFT